MHCTFYRPKEINCEEFENIIGKLTLDLIQLKNQELDDFTVFSYVYFLSRQALPFRKRPEMTFFDLVKPDEVPSDIRVLYVYFPTYIATAFMMQAILKFPCFIEGSGYGGCDLDLSADALRKRLRGCMLACTGRGFAGHGYDTEYDFNYCMKLFTYAGAEKFVELYPDICPEFTALFQDALKHYTPRI